MINRLAHRTWFVGLLLVALFFLPAALRGHAVAIVAIAMAAFWSGIEFTEWRRHEMVRRTWQPDDDI